MSSLWSGMAPHSSNDPLFERLVRAEYIEAERLRSRIVAVLFFTGAGLLLLRLTMGWLGVIQVEAWAQVGTLLGVGTTAALGTLQLVVHAGIERAPSSRRLFWYARPSSKWE